MTILEESSAHSLRMGGTFFYMPNQYGHLSLTCIFHSVMIAVRLRKGAEMYEDEPES